VVFVVVGKRWWKRLSVALLSVVLLGAGAVAVVFLWPLGSDDLRSATPRTFDYGAAVAEGQRVTAAESGRPEVLAECRTQLLTHGKRTARAVLLLHGYTDCPRQMTGLARRFFEKGYNVYVPPTLSRRRLTRHGSWWDTPAPAST
jgi:carboxylesterase